MGSGGYGAWEPIAPKDEGGWEPIAPNPLSVPGALDPSAPPSFNRATNDLGLLTGDEPPPDNPLYYLNEQGQQRPIAEKPIEMLGQGRRAVMRAGRRVGEKLVSGLPRPEDTTPFKAGLSGFVKEAVPRIAEQATDPLNLALMAGPAVVGKLAAAPRMLESLQAARDILAAAETPEEIAVASAEVARLFEASKNSAAISEGAATAGQLVGAPIGIEGAGQLAEGVRQGNPEQIASGAAGLAGGLAGVAHGIGGRRAAGEAKAILDQAVEERKLRQAAPARFDRTPPQEPAAPPVEALPAAPEKPPADITPVIPTPDVAPPTDRRSNLTERRRVAEMTPQEKDRALLIDEKTGLGNERAWAEAQPTISPDAHVLALDLKRFKALNDTYGHDAGDAALRQVGAVLSEHLGADKAFRPHGDEFIGLAEGGLERSQAAADAVRQRIADSRVTVIGPDGSPVEIQGLEAHIGVGRTLKEAESALNEAAAPSRAGGRGAPAGPAVLPDLGRPEQGAGAPVGSGVQVPQDRAAPAAVGRRPFPAASTERRTVADRRAAIRRTEMMRRDQARREAAGALVNQDVPNVLQDERNQPTGTMRIPGGVYDSEGSLGVKSARTGTALDGLPYELDAIRKAWQAQQAGRPLTRNQEAVLRDVHRAAAGDPRVDEALAAMEEPALSPTRASAVDQTPAGDQMRIAGTVRPESAPTIRTEGREGAGPLFRQEQEAALREEAKKQEPLFPQKDRSGEVGAVRTSSAPRVKIKATGEVGTIDGYEKGPTGRMIRVRVGDKLIRVRANEVSALPFEPLRPEGSGGPPEATAPSGGAPLPSDPAAKLIELVRVAKPVLGQTRRLRHAELSRRAGEVGKVTRGGGGEATLAAAKMPMRGELPAADFEPVRPKLTQQDVDSLFNQVWNHPQLRPFEQVNTADALANILSPEGGRLPQQRELVLMERVFGPAFVDAVLSRRSTWDKIRGKLTDYANVPRALMASFDFSAPFRQGLVLTTGHPRIAGRAMWPMVKSAFSEQAFRGIEQEIRARPNLELYDRFGLHLADITSKAAKLSAREEMFRSRTAEKIPILGRFVRGSDRAYTAYLNKLRADVFDSSVRDLQAAKITPEEAPAVYRDTARWINIATGRGELGTFGERVAPALGEVFFSPRLIASRFQLLNPVTYIKLEPAVRKRAMREMASLAAFGTTMIGLGAMSGAPIEDDVRSSDFGRIRLGRTRVDPWGGLQPWVRVYAQIASGERKTLVGNIKELSGQGPFPETRGDVALRFGRGKLSPQASIIADWFAGKDFQGQPFTATQALKDRVVPMAARDFYEAVQEHGAVKGSALGAASALGLGVSTYQPYGLRGDETPDQGHALDALREQRAALRSQIPQKASKPLTPEERIRRMRQEIRNLEARRRRQQRGPVATAP